MIYDFLVSSTLLVSIVHPIWMICWNIHCVSDIACIYVQNGGKFLIRHNTQKRQKLQEDDDDIDFEKSEVICFYCSQFIHKYEFVLVQNIPP